ncbi:MAG: ATP-binding protein [Phycisphaeraceae bacterium]
MRGLNAIVCDVLSFAREIRPRSELVPIVDLFERAVDANLPALDAANVDVVFDDSLEEGDCVAVDRDLIHQALVNLIRNAVEAMAAGAPPCRDGALTLAARREDDHFILIVRDTGPGIAEADVDRIFNPFFTTRNTGTGLGLAIVHRIVDAHGGSISVYNDDGAVFEIRIPSHDAEKEHGSAS